MVFEVTYLVRKQEGIRHELVINREESLQPTDDYTEDVLLRKMIHQRITIEKTLSHFDNVKVVVSESHAIPQECSIAWLVCFSVAVLANDVLDSVELTSAVICVHHYLRSPNPNLLFSINQLVLEVSRLLLLWFVKIIDDLALCSKNNLLMLR